jgi:AsmA protein
MDSKFIIDGDYKVSNNIPMFDLDIDIKDLDINKAYQMFIDDTELAPAEGAFSTKYALKGNLTPDFSIITSDLKGKGTIYIDNVSVKELKLFNHIKGISKKDEFNNPQLNEVVLDTEIKDSKFLIYPCTIKVNKFLTEIEGEQTFDSKMNYMVKISVPPLKKVKIPISIVGTTDKPAIKLGKGFDNSDFERLE